MIKILYYFIEVNMIKPLTNFIGNNWLITLIYGVLVITSCIAFWNYLRTTRMAKKSGKIEGNFFKRLKEPYIEQYIYKYGGRSIKFKTSKIFLLYIFICMLVFLKTRSYYLLFAIFGSIELFNAWDIYITHMFFQKYLRGDRINILKISILDQRKFNIILSNYILLGLILMILSLFGTRVYVLKIVNMFKIETVFKIIIYIVLIFIIISVRNLNKRLLNYKTDEGRIYVRYPEKNVKRYVDTSKNWKIRFKPLILVIMLFASIGFIVYVILKFRFKKLYLIFQIFGIIALYNTWSLYEDHIFLKEYLKLDPTNSLRFSILEDEVYKRLLRTYLLYGIILILLPMLIPII